MYEIFEQLVKRKGVKVADVARATGINQAVFSEWKKGKSTPKADKKQKIADYFGVPLDYLVSGRESDLSESTLSTKDERDISKQLNDALEKLSSSDALMFDGEALDDETRELLKNSIENSLRMGKIIAKQKFTPKKYKNKK